jgi:hypothetical protein
MISSSFFTYFFQIFLFFAKFLNFLFIAVQICRISKKSAAFINPALGLIHLGSSNSTRAALSPSAELSTLYTSSRRATRSVHARPRSMAWSDTMSGSMSPRAPEFAVRLSQTRRLRWVQCLGQVIMIPSGSGSTDFSYVKLEMHSDL